METHSAWTKPEYLIRLTAYQGMLLTSSDIPPELIPFEEIAIFICTVKESHVHFYSIEYWEISF